MQNIPLFFRKYEKQLNELCKKNKVQKLYAFGSVCTENFDTQRSDIDLIVSLYEMQPVEKGETLLNLWREFEKIFSKQVDLMTDKPIKNPYLKQSVEKSKTLIYEG